MTDRELLELAAKAAGMPIHAANQAQRDACGAGDVGLWISNDTTCWNPLTDDGDALRLAVKCGIVVEYRREVPACFAYHYALNLEVVQRNDQLDPYVATRRAIVRAAAEIGRRMK